ncbi:hypothetical protein Fmac_001778 [Flemingia macrophylla]|uniref:Bromo domain-containing protein n=1 Tax=Flemingia macrophylla TaxID=520843 RepID=A0ABD1NJR5_9FABA
MPPQLFTFPLFLSLPFISPSLSLHAPHPHLFTFPLFLSFPFLFASFPILSLPFLYSALTTDLRLRHVHVDTSYAKEIADTIMALFLGLLRRTHLISRHALSASSWLGSIQPLCRGMRRYRNLVLGIVEVYASARRPAFTISLSPSYSHSRALIDLIHPSLHVWCPLTPYPLASVKSSHRRRETPRATPRATASATSRLLFPSRASSPLSRRDRHLRVTATTTLESHLERHSHSDVGDSVNLWRFTLRDREADRRRRCSLDSHPREPPGETLPQRCWRQRWVFDVLSCSTFLRKDTHGVFSEPVDPEELPDYHDIIKQPMDYGTVRKKLDKGLYPDLEQFEVGVAIFSNRFLECDLLLVSRQDLVLEARINFSVDPINEEKLRNKSWIDAAGGITNKGRLYGVGKVGSALRLGDAFPNLSSGRSTQESEKILHWNKSPSI